MSHARLLVVEDEVIVSRDIRQQLQRLGYNVVGHATTADRAIDLTGQLLPQLVLMDINLGGVMDGIEAAKVIRQRWAIPVVFLTAFNADDMLARAKLAEPYGYIIKPFSESDLRTTIEMALYKYETDVRLRESEERLSLILQGSTDAAWDWNLKTGAMFYSPRWWEMIGYEANELPSDADLWQRLMHPDDAAPVNELLADLANKTDSVLNFEFRIRHKDGHYIPVLTRGKIQRDAAGVAIRVAGTNTDMTPIKRTEEALRLNQEQLSQFFETSMDGFYFVEINPPLQWDGSIDKEQVIDFFIKHHHVARFNKALSDQYRVSVEDYAKRNEVDSFYDDVPQTRNFFRTVFDSGRCSMITFEHRFDDSPMVIEGNYACTYDDVGRIKGYFGVQRDISERRAVDQALRDSEFRWKYAIEGSGDGLWDWDVANDSLFLNERWKALLGYGAGEISNSTAYWQQLIHPDDRARILLEMEKYLQGQSAVYECEYRLAIQNGGWRWVLDRGMVVARDAKQNPLRMIGTYSDITARINLESAERDNAEFLERMHVYHNELLALIDDPNALMVLAAERISSLLEATYGEVMLCEGDEIIVRAITNLNFAKIGDRAIRGHAPMTFQAYDTGKPVRVDGYETWPGARGDYVGKGIGSAAAIPLVHANRVIGVLGFARSHSLPAFSNTEISRAQLLAETLALALHHAEQQATLARSIAWQEALLAYAGHAIISTTADGFVQTFNRAAEQMLGYTADEIIGKHTPALFHDTDEVVRCAQEFSLELGVTIEPGFEVFRAKSRLGLPNEHEWTYVHKDGTRLPIWLTMTALKNASGEITGFLGIANDITELKASQQALIDSAENMRKIISASPVPTVLNDASYRITYLNQAFIDTFGYTLDDMPTVEAWRLKAYPDPTYRQKVSDAWAEQVRDAAGKAMAFTPLEWDVTCRDGSIKTVLLSATSITDSGDDSFLAVLYDITDRRVAENRIREQLDELLRWQKVMLTREGRVQQLKKEVNDVLASQGKTARYPSQSLS